MDSVKEKAASSVQFVASAAKVLSLPVVLGTAALVFALEHSEHCGGRISIGHAPAGGPYVPRDVRAEAAVCWVGVTVAVILTSIGSTDNKAALLIAAVNWIAVHSALASLSKEMCADDSTLQAGFWFVQLTLVVSNWQLAFKKSKAD